VGVYENASTQSHTHTYTPTHTHTHSPRSHGQKEPVRAHDEDFQFAAETEYDEHDRHRLSVRGGGEGCERESVCV
jgi:hypothetical protein